ncbi:hypothetical protein HPP92_007495 [Vanilla planifolia]|uniref:Uncharacterized protein n=1 Tax=Vanilla planifolia TaxID=51239 RepID=A0A835RRA5_VANPL|nr:hypothetical protein HPP92_007495 [Vanilla planifolia]
MICTEPMEGNMAERYLSSNDCLNSWHCNSQSKYCLDAFCRVHSLVDVKLSSEGKEVQDNMSKIEICSSEVAKTIGQENSEVEQELRADKASISDLNCSTKEEIHNNAPPDSRAILKEPVEDSMTEGYVFFYNGLNSSHGNLQAKCCTDEGGKFHTLADANVPFKGKEALGNWPKQGTIGMAEVGNIHFPADFKVFSVEQAVSIDKELDLRGEKSLLEKDRENNDERYKRWRASDEDKNDIGNSMQLGIVKTAKNKMAENEMKGYVA